MELALGIIPLITEATTTCYTLYGNARLRHANRAAAKLLAEHLREVESSLRLTTVNEAHVVERGILSELQCDLRRITACVDAAMHTAARRNRLSVVFDAASISQQLDRGLELTLAWKARLEALQLAAAQHENMEQYFQQCHALIAKYDSLVERLPQHVRPAASFKRDAGDCRASAAAELPDIASVRDLVRHVSTLQDACHVQEEDILLEKDSHGHPRVLTTGPCYTFHVGTVVLRDENAGSSQVLRVAVKQFSVAPSNRTALRMHLQHLALLQMSVRHRCILRCHGTSELSSGPSVEPGFVTELMTCDLATAVRDGRLNSFTDKIRIATDLANALTYLHAHNIVHCRVEPANVLVELDDHGRIIGYAKLGDFEEAVRVERDAGSASNANASSVGPKKRTARLNMHAPPEATSEDRPSCISRKWDVWSYGVLLCFLFSNESPPSSKELEAALRGGACKVGILQQWANSILVSDVREIVRKCLHSDSNRRPSIDAFDLNGVEDEQPTPSTAATDAPDRADVMGLSADDLDLLLDLEDISSNFKKVEGSTRGSSAVSENGEETSKPSSCDSVLSVGLRDLNMDSTNRTGVNMAEAAIPLSGKMQDRAAAEGFVLLGLRYLSGDGMEHDEKQGLQLLERAVSRGHARAQLELGKCCEQGIGSTQKDTVRAAELYALAARQGNAEALYRLGECYANGTGVARGERRAAELFARAAEGGMAVAMMRLGQCWAEGRGVEKNECIAVKLFNRAVALGDGEAMYELSVCFAKGRGVSKDEERARQLRVQAEMKGVDRAKHGPEEFCLIC